MSPHDEEDFELVLGNRQLFFLAVVLFGVFFSIGYTVGYSRGSESADEVAAATDPASETTAVAQAPQTDAGTRTPATPAPAKTQTVSARASSDDSDSPSGAISAKPATRPAAEAPKQELVARNTPATPPPARRPSISPNTKTRAAPAGAQNSASSASPRKSPSKPAAGVQTVAVPEIVRGSIYLQVAASREAGPARQVLLNMKAKGHPVAMDNMDPAWFRILVGPFPTKEAAAEYQLKLTAEKIDSFIRKL